MPATQTSPTIEIENLDHFVALITGWHNHKMDILRHMKEVPTGTSVTFDNEEMTMEGDLLKGFLIGLTVALSEVSTLPFGYETEGNEPDQTNATIQ
jgi:hypothetical protein